MSVKDYMTRQVITVSTETPVVEAVHLLRQCKIKGIPVVNEDNKVVGLFTLRNLLYLIESNMDTTMPVKQVMQSDVLQIDEETPLDEICLLPRKRLPVLDGAGKLVGILTKSDIIRGFKAETVGVKQFLKTVLEAAPQAIIAVDQRNNISFFNAAAERSLGVAAFSVIGNPLESLLPEWVMLREMVLEQGQTIRNSHNKTHYGEYVVNAAPVFDEDSIVGAVIILQPLSDIEQIAEELKLVKQLYKELNAVIESSYDGIFVTDNKGIVERVNAAAAKLLNLPSSDVIGRPASSVANALRFDACITDRVIAEQAAQSVSFKQQGRTVALTGNPVFDETGNIIRVITNVRDLTELSALRQELEQVSRLKDMYYSEVARLKAMVAPCKAAFRSEEMQRIYDLALRVAVVDTPVLIQGESGVGKEMLANYIHENSNRKKQPFVKVNCAAIPETLLESELFGYVEGAFTGAKKGGKPGVFELAHGGTLFLDEVGDLPLAIQPKLLRALQDQEVFKLGGSRPVKFDARLLFATNKNLEEEAKSGRFREDLYYRMNVIPITVPPLKNRPADIAVLSAAFLNKFNQKYHTEKRLSPDVLEAFTTYHWPGNVRELMNNIERLVITSRDDLMTISDLPGNLLAQVDDKASFHHAGALPLKDVIEMVECDVIGKSLQECKSLRQAARTLGIDPSTLLRKAKKYRISIGG